MKKTIYLLLFILLFAPFLLHAQSDSTSSTLISTNVIVRYQSADFSSFNQTATDLGYPTFDSRLLGIGGEFQYTQGRSVNSLGFVWYEANSETTVNASQKGAFFNQWEIQFRSEYDLLSNDKWVLSPGVGWAIQWSQLGLSDRAEVNGVEQALNTEVQKITRFDVPIDLALSLQRHIQLGEGMNSLLLGLRGGYRLDFGDDEWKTDGVIPMSDPGIDPSGWFLSLRVGLSGPKAKDSRL